MMQMLAVIYLVGALLVTLFLVIASFLSGSGFPGSRREWIGALTVIALWPLVMIVGFL